MLGSMAPGVCSKISSADALVLGAIQILIGIFHVFMWYFILILYMGQIKGTFGTYEPITYRTGCTLWGIVFIISGVFLIRVAKHPSQRLVVLALITNIFCVITTIIAVTLTVIELSKFHSVSYKNYGQAKLGREVSRILLFSYPLELALAFAYSIFGCIDLVFFVAKDAAFERIKDIYGQGHIVTVKHEKKSKKSSVDTKGNQNAGVINGVLFSQAIQIVTGLILHWLGLIWAYLLVTQLPAFEKSYMPLAAFTGYPFWSSFSFILTGVFTVLFEKRRSRLLISYTIIVNIISACISVIGLLLLLLEFLLFHLSSSTPIWPHRSGILLSQYLFLFILVELFVTCIVIHWAYKATYRR